MNRPVQSKQRVADHGEVFTNQKIVNDMLDLVQQETERIDSRFLEPACGTGNFLVEILRRKLDMVEKNYRRSQLEFERNLVLAVSSIYGIDILEDNVIACRQRGCLSWLMSGTPPCSRKRQKMPAAERWNISCKRISFGATLFI
jgi:hypothetical protein